MKKLTLSGVISALAACGGGGGDSGQPINLLWSQTGLVVADLYGDGRTDIVVANACHAQIPVADGARRVAIADLNGDSIPDIALGSMVYQALSTPSRISVLLQSSTAGGQVAAANT